MLNAAQVTMNALYFEHQVLESRKGFELRHGVCDEGISELILNPLASMATLLYDVTIDDTHQFTESAPYLGVDAAQLNLPVPNLSRDEFERAMGRACLMWLAAQRNCWRANHVNGENLENILEAADDYATLLESLKH